jgi:twitching motility protein PilT
MNTTAINLTSILEFLIKKEGSDLHLIVGSPPMLRINGVLTPVSGAESLDKKTMVSWLSGLLTETQLAELKEKKELDIAYQLDNKGRFRVNVYHSQQNLAAAFRLIPAKIKTIDELSLPSIFHDFTKYRQGLVLLTGPTGEGKSTSIASMLDEINSTRAEHIVTVEDPIEFVYQPKKSIISQREIKTDTNDWDRALRSVLREDPNVVLIGELRDFETISSAITIAETGHLVFATLHTNTASQAIDRLIDVFPARQQQQIRMQLSSVIQAVVAQRLLPSSKGGRVPAFEIMKINSAIRNLIREVKTFQIDNVMQTSSDAGMILMENYLQKLFQQGVISKELAINRAFRPAEMERLLGK